MRMASKWKKHLILARHPSIRRHLPETYLLNQRSLFHLLQKYPVVFLKPVKGTGGNGIIRIRRSGNAYDVQTSSVNRVVRDRRNLFGVVTRLTRRRSYLVQQGISLLTIHQRQLDYRILMLKPGHSWLSMGIMGKWAAPNNIVTNYCRGGSPIRLGDSLKRSLRLSNEQIRMMEQRITNVGYRVARAMGDPYAMREMGLDIGIDQDRRIWVLEVNTGPKFELFRFHADKTRYRTIAGYMRKIRSGR